MTWSHKHITKSYSTTLDHILTSMYSNGLTIPCMGIGCIESISDWQSSCQQGSSGYKVRGVHRKEVVLNSV